jgi:hypothetical protein
MVGHKDNLPGSESKDYMCRIRKITGFGVMLAYEPFRSERFWVTPHGGIGEHKATSRNSSVIRSNLRTNENTRSSHESWFLLGWNIHCNTDPLNLYGVKLLFIRTYCFIYHDSKVLPKGVPGRHRKLSFHTASVYGRRGLSAIVGRFSSPMARTISSWTFLAMWGNINIA